MQTEATITSVRSVQRKDPDVLDHFKGSAALYRKWSPEGHLHFGYWKWPMSPFDRRAMLEELVYQVMEPMELRAGGTYADFGCGYGTAAITIARRYNVHVDAYTVVPEQAREGMERAEREKIDDLVTMHHADMRCTGLPDGGMDGVIGMESWCYGTGTAKRDVIREAYRVLRPGGMISLVDGFLVKRPDRLRKPIVDMVQRGWALECFPQRDDFIEALKAEGFRDIKIVDLGSRIGTCALHGPPLMLITMIEHVTRKHRLDRFEWAHLKSCMLGILLGTQLDLFRYLGVTATKG